MHAERLILETDTSGKLKNMPLLPPNKQVEVILIVISEINEIKPIRKPHPDIAGKTKILGDIINTVREDQWDLPK
jgi:hypothetical protein